LLLFSFTLEKETTAMKKKVADSRARGKGLDLLEGEEVFVGVDVHKKTYSVSVWSAQRGLVTRWVQPALVAVLAGRLEAIKSQVVRVVYEAGPTGFGLYRGLRGLGFSVDVVAPSKTPSVPAALGKSDRRDADTLAFLAWKGMLQAVAVPGLEEEADRQVSRRHKQAAGDAKRAKHRIKSLLLQHGLAEPAGLEHWSRAAIEALRQLPLREGVRFTLDGLLSDLRHAQEQVDQAKAQLAKLAESERHATAVSLLRKVPGVGLLTAMTFRTEVLRPERFQTAEQLASFCGLAPWVSRSGSTTRKGPITKAGNARVRTVLVEAAWQWVRRDPGARRLYRRLVANTASRQKAVVAMARRLAVLLWGILVTGDVYCPEAPPHEAAAATGGPGTPAPTLEAAQTRS
jgi:transposase